MFFFTVWCLFLYVYICVFFFFFFKQKTAYEMRISDWSSDVCSSDLVRIALGARPADVIRMLLSQSFRWIAVGLAMGTIGALGLARQIGRASCRERGWQYV